MTASLPTRAWSGLVGILLAGTGLFSACQPPAVVQTSKPTPATTSPSRPSPTLTLSGLPTPPIASTTEDNPMNEVPISPPFDAFVTGQIEQAKADLAKRLSMQAAQIELAGIFSVTWSDGSLGCPKPGMLYTQSLVDGLRMQLRADGKIYNYHSGAGKPPFLCEQPGQ